MRKHKTKFEKAFPKIVSFFDTNKLQNKYIYTSLEMKKIISRFDLAQNDTVTSVIAKLIGEGYLNQYTIKNSYQTFTRYSWGTTSSFEVIATLSHKTYYFSHLSALYFNNLTNQIPKNFYLNREQFVAGQNNSQPIPQDNVDRAFRAQQRTSSNTAFWGNLNLTFITSKSTSELGVIDKIVDNFGYLRTTNVERTLIDITIRPQYSGGVHEVLNSFKKAQENVSINKLAGYLHHLAYRYPYHQAIGLYMTLAGNYTSKQRSLLKGIPQKLDFYLAYGMSNPKYSKEWRCYYPRDL